MGRNHFDIHFRFTLTTAVVSAPLSQWECGWRPAEAMMPWTTSIMERRPVTPTLDYSHGRYFHLLASQSMWISVVFFLLLANGLPCFFSACLIACIMIIRVTKKGTSPCCPSFFPSLSHTISLWLPSPRRINLSALSSVWFSYFTTPAAMIKRTRDALVWPIHHARLTLYVCGCRIDYTSGW